MPDKNQRRWPRLRAAGELLLGEGVYILAGCGIVTLSTEAWRDILATGWSLAIVIAIVVLANVITGVKAVRFIRGERGRQPESVQEAMYRTSADLEEAQLAYVEARCRAAAYWLREALPTAADAVFDMVEGNHFDPQAELVRVLDPDGRILWDAEASDPGNPDQSVVRAVEEVLTDTDGAGAWISADGSTDDDSAGYRRYVLTIGEALTTA